LAAEADAKLGEHAPKVLGTVNAALLASGYDRF
jgi:hypothetical protein